MTLLFRNGRETRQKVISGWLVVQQGSWHVDDEHEALAKAVLARRTDIQIDGRLNALDLLQALQVWHMACCSAVSPACSSMHQLSALPICFALHPCHHACNARFMSTPGLLYGALMCLMMRTGA